MQGRLPRVGAAAGAALLLFAALRTVHAETAYEAGLRLAADPATSPAAGLPGRLEAYETAMRRDPGEALYALRAAQIRLARARPRGAAPDRAELEAARTLLIRAAGLRPLDGIVHATLAQAERVRRDPGAAVNAVRTAVRVAPRSPGVLRAAVSVGLWAWRESGDPACLEPALSGGAGLLRLREPDALSAFAPAFAEAGATLAGDLAEATARDPALRAFAAECARAVRPEVARVLSGAEPAVGAPR